MKELYKQLGVSSQVYDYGEKILAGLKDQFAEVDRLAEYNQA